MLKLGIATIYFVIFTFYAFITYKKDFISLPLIFLASQCMMFIGILSYADTGNPADAMLLYIYLGAQVLFICGVEFAKKFERGKKGDSVSVRQDALSNTQKLRIHGMIAVSIAACLYLFYAMNTNVFVNVLKSVASGESRNITEARLASYSVTGIGYVYQFRVVLLPILTAYLISYAQKTDRKLGLILFPIMIVFLLGTGQRGGFVTFIMMWVLSLFYFNKLMRQEKKKKIFAIFAIAFALFTVMTIANGRVTSSNKNVFSAIIQRFTNDNQQTAVIGFRYIYKQPTQWGHDWFNMLLDILPGKNDYMPVANRVFEIMYGSSRGTSPPCIWGSAYYNWGLFGVTVFPFLMGVAYRMMYCRLYKYPVTPIRILLYSSMFVVLGMWISDAPMALINQGLVTMIFLAWVLHIDKNALKNARSETAA